MNYNVKQTTKSNTTIWIALNDSHSWLYSSPKKQAITIHCKDGEIKKMIENTDKIILKNNCKNTRYHNKVS